MAGNFINDIRFKQGCSAGICTLTVMLNKEMVTKKEFKQEVFIFKINKAPGKFAGALFKSKSNNE